MDQTGGNWRERVVLRSILGRLSSVTRRLRPPDGSPAPCRWRRALVCLLAGLFVVPVAMRADSAAATARAAAEQESGPEFCSVEQICYPPAPLLNLEQAMYAATADQAASLRELEAQAVDDLIEMH